MLVVAAFFGGVAWQRRLDKPVWWGSHIGGTFHNEFEIQEMVMPDGEVSEREWHSSGWKRSGALSANETQVLADEMSSESSNASPAVQLEDVVVGRDLHRRRAGNWRPGLLYLAREPTGHRAGQDTGD